MKERQMNNYLVDISDVNSVEGTRDFFKDQVNEIIMAYLRENNLLSSLDLEGNSMYKAYLKINNMSDELLTVYWNRTLSPEEKIQLLNQMITQMFEILKDFTSQKTNKFKIAKGQPRKYLRKSNTL